MNKQKRMKLTNNIPIYTLNGMLENIQFAVAFLVAVVFGALVIQDGIALMAFGVIAGFLIGLLLGYKIREEVYRHKAIQLRDIVFEANEIPSIDVLYEKIKYISKYGMNVELKDDVIAVTSRNTIYDIAKVDDTSFIINWHKTIARALFGYQTFHGIFVAANHDMGQIGYAVTVACSGTMDSEREISIVTQPDKKEGLVGTIISVICCVILVGGMIFVANNLISGDNNNEYVEMVKTANPIAYPEKTYGEAFDSFFLNPKWEYFKAETGENVIEFTGKCTYHDAEVLCRIQFILSEDKETVELGAFSMNDVPQAEYMTYGLVTAVFENASLDSIDKNESTANDDTEQTENVISEDADVLEESISDTEDSVEISSQDEREEVFRQDDGAFEPAEVGQEVLAENDSRLQNAPNMYVSGDDSWKLFANFDPIYSDDGEYVVGYDFVGCVYSNGEYVTGFYTVLDYFDTPEENLYEWVDKDEEFDVYLNVNTSTYTVIGPEICPGCYFTGDFYY